MRILLILALISISTCYTVLQITDFHMDINYSTNGTTSSFCHNANGSQGNLGTYGDYMCDAPESLVAFTLDQAKQTVPNPDLILWTGDNVPHIENYTWQYVFQTINITTSLLKQKYNNITIIPTMGNHDYAPANAFDEFSTLYSYTWDLWKDWLPADQKNNFLTGGYYRYLLKDAKILVLNTNLYYVSNAAFSNFTHQDDPAGMFAFMESELNKTLNCQDGTTDCLKIVHIVAHMPPGVFERTPDFKWFRDQYNQKYLDIVLKYANVIGLMIYGHHHTDTFHLIKDSNGTAVQLSLMAPAVTPWFSSLAGAGSNNPTFRVFDLMQNYTINDISTYFIELSALNANPKTTFKLEYQFKKAYGINAIDPSTMDGVLQRMKTDNNLFLKYLTYNSAGWNVTVPTGQFRGAQLCSIEFSDYPRYNNCMAAYKKAPALVSLFVPIISFFCYFLNC